MLLASSSYSYPILGAFWTIFMIFLWVIWFWILITIFIDLFRSHDLSGWAKALWFIFILLLPLIGVLVYLIARGGKMHEHQVRDVQAQEQELRRYVQDADQREDQDDYEPQGLDPAVQVMAAEQVDVDGDQDPEPDHPQEDHQDRPERAQDRIGVRTRSKQHDASLRRRAPASAGAQD